MVNEYNKDINSIRLKVLEFMIILKRLTVDYYIENVIGDDYINKVQNNNNLKELKIWCKEKIWFIGNEIKKLKVKRLSSIIIKSLEYIDSNFCHEIKLEDVAKHVSISPHYFSKLFKDETGKNFIEYLTTIKINLAKELLEEGNLSIKEICYKIGYKDPNYFSRLFKKN